MGSLRFGQMASIRIWQATQIHFIRELGLINQVRIALLITVNAKENI